MIPSPRPTNSATLARELECDEDEKAFEERVRKVVTTPQAKPEPASKSD